MKTEPAHLEDEVVLLCAAVSVNLSGSRFGLSVRDCPQDAAWAIVRDSAGMTSTGHAGAVRWARALLELNDPGETDAPRRRRTGPHVCGWARVEGVWRCAQDFHATGSAPRTGCGQAWDKADQP
jgi:hypothetical protein